MKKQIMQLSIYLSMLLLSTSCKKEIEKNPVQQSEEIQTGAPPPGGSECNINYNVDSIGYALCHLNVIGEEVIRMAQDNAFRQATYQYIEQQFDGDDNVLIKTFLPRCATGGDLPIASQRLLNSLAAFQNINGDTLFPQIYIPNYQSLKSRGLIGVSQPIIIPYAYQDEPNDSYTAYTLDSRGQYIQLPNKVSESNATLQEVWVIMTNESVDDQGNISSGNGGGPASRQVPCRLDKVKIGNWKEKWISGKNDFSMRSYLTTWNGYDLYTPTEHFNTSATNYSNNYTGCLLKKLDFNSYYQIEKTIDVNFESNWFNNNFYTDDIVCVYVLFERDNWPAGKTDHVVTLPNNGATFYMTYRSKDPSYYGGVVYNNVSGLPLLQQTMYNASSYNRDIVGEIKFNLITR